MVFSSYNFILFFLVVYAGYSITRRFMGLAACKIWIVAASLFFYGHGNIAYLPLLVGTTVFNYAASAIMSRYKSMSKIKNLVFAAAIAENLGFLIFFKYTDFLIYNINRVAGSGFLPFKTALPLGISFFTFQILIYIIGVYRDKTTHGSFLDFTFFVTFFPKLIVGPIMRYDDMERQLRGGNLLSFDSGNAIKGLMLFSFGCAKKVLIADAMISHAQGFYDTALSGGHFFSAWIGVAAYTFAFYFDFSGYIDMALGLACLFNIELPVNFNSPYKARDFADFWRRWNITISKFFNDYVFSGIFKFGDRAGKLIAAVMLTFLVSGVWHGAGWNFIFWGLVNGLFVCIANLMTLRRIKLPAFPAWLLTFLMVMLTRVLFDSSNMTQALHVYRLMFDIRPVFTDGAAFLGLGAGFFSANIRTLLLILVSALICFFPKNSNEIVRENKSKWYHAALCGGLLCLSLFFMSGVSNFLYFQF